MTSANRRLYTTLPRWLAKLFAMQTLMRTFDDVMAERSDGYIRGNSLETLASLYCLGVFSRRRRSRQARFLASRGRSWALAKSRIIRRSPKLVSIVRRSSRRVGRA